MMPPAPPRCQEEREGWCTPTRPSNRWPRALSYSSEHRSLWLLHGPVCCSIAPSFWVCFSSPFFAPCDSSCIPFLTCAHFIAGLLDLLILRDLGVFRCSPCPL